jgi:glycosyltransferase involved in cell wall biosynthesis
VNIPTDPPLVSVVVATNRSGPYLDEALRSVADQTWPRVELVIVDDGSSDPEAVDQAALAVDGARVIHQAASGVSIARNVGVADTSGDFIAFLDDDDRWHPRRLERLMSALGNEPLAAVAYSAMRTVDATGSRELAPADQVAVESRLDVARRRTGIILPAIMIRRSAFVAVGGFHSRIRLAQDLDLILRLAEYGDFVFVPSTLVDYRASAQNVTRRHRELTRSIDHVLRFHRWAAHERGDVELVAALGESLRKNARFAWWGAGRRARAALRDRRLTGAVGELAWALREAPGGLVDGLVRRLRRGCPSARRGANRSVRGAR